MRELEIGVRINMKTGISFFGTDDVNALIRAGATVVSIEPGGVIMEKLGDEGGSVRLTLSGLKLTVRLAEQQSDHQPKA